MLPLYIIKTVSGTVSRLLTQEVQAGRSHLLQFKAVYRRSLQSHQGTFTTSTRRSINFCPRDFHSASHRTPLTKLGPEAEGSSCAQMLRSSESSDACTVALSPASAPTPCLCPGKPGGGSLEPEETKGEACGPSRGYSRSAPAHRVTRVHSAHSA